MPSAFGLPRIAIPWAGPKWGKGASFPSNAVTGDRWTRTDRNLDYFYDGLRWLTVQEFYTPGVGQTALNASATGLSLYTPLWNGDYDVWIDKIDVITYAGALTGSDYWTAQVNKQQANETEVSLGSATNQSGTSANYEYRQISVGAVVAAPYKHLRWNITKTGAPGNLYIFGAVRYRLVG